MILDSHDLMLFIILYQCYVKEGVSCFLKIILKFSFEYINVESIIRKNILSVCTVHEIVINTYETWKLNGNFLSYKPKLWFLLQY